MDSRQRTSIGLWEDACCMRYWACYRLSCNICGIWFSANGFLGVGINNRFLLVEKCLVWGGSECTLHTKRKRRKKYRWSCGCDIFLKFVVFTLLSLSHISSFVHSILAASFSFLGEPRPRAVFRGSSTRLADVTTANAFSVSEQETRFSLHCASSLIVPDICYNEHQRFYVALSFSPSSSSTTQPVPAILQPLCHALCQHLHPPTPTTLPFFFFVLQVSHYRLNTCPDQAPCTV